MEEKIKKLPKWAQMHIAALGSQISELEGRVKQAEVNKEIPAKVERDVAPPESWGKLSKGWDFNEYILKEGDRINDSAVFKCCSSPVSHGRGWEETTSQRPLWLFSSQERAWRAARAEFLDGAGKKIHLLDTKIAELVAPQSQNK